MYHKINLIGNLGHAPSLKFSPNGKAFATFSVAVNEKFGSETRTMWVRVTAWDTLAELCKQYLDKGSKVYIEGRLAFDDKGCPRTWARRDGTTGTAFEVVASVVRFLDSAKERQSADAREKQPENLARQVATVGDVPVEEYIDSLDSIPF